MKQIAITKSDEQTKKQGLEFAKKLKGQNIIIALYGDLGSGKTTFVQGLAEGLGIKRRIISPTFIIVRSYKLRTQHPAPSTFYHIDLYRISGEKDIEGLGLKEILNDEHAIVAIEWAEKIKNLLPKKRWDIHFKYISDNERKIIISRKD